MAKSNKVAHIINPFHAPENSDLRTAQPITFKSMLEAKKKAEGIIDVELFSAQFVEDRGLVPIEFQQTEDLDQSVLDYGTFKKSIKLPLVKDLIDRLFNSTDAEYLIYTNVDIGLYPNFYLRVNELIEDGYDAFIINRRRIPTHYGSVEQIQEIWELKGKKHPGFDCFVFHRDIVPKLVLNSICIGVPFFEITLSQNLFALAKNFKLISDEICTFHIGMEIFKGRVPKEYFLFNQKEFWKSANDKNLRNSMRISKIPFSQLPLPIRIIKWGLHPCFPIRFMLRLEWENLLRILKK